MLLCFLLFFSATLQNVGQPVLVLGALHASSSTYSALIMVNEIGFAVGTIFRARGVGLGALLKRMLSAILVMALAALGYALADSAWVTLTPFLLAGIGNTVVLVVVFTVYVKVTPSEYLARVIGIHVAIGTAAMVLSFLLSGVLISALGVHGAFRLEAIAIATTLVLGILLLRPMLSGDMLDASGVEQRAAVLEEA